MSPFLSFSPLQILPPSQQIWIHSTVWVRKLHYSRSRYSTDIVQFSKHFSRQDTPPYLPLGPSMTIRPFCPFFPQQGVLFFSPLFALSGNLDSKPCTHDARETKQPSVSVSIARSQITVRVLDSLSPHILILLISKLSRQKLRKHKSNSFKKSVRDFSHFKISSSISSATHTEGHTLAEPPES